MHPQHPPNYQPPHMGAPGQHPPQYQAPMGGPPGHLPPPPGHMGPPPMGGHPPMHHQPPMHQPPHMGGHPHMHQPPMGGHMGGPPMGGPPMGGHMGGPPMGGDPYKMYCANPRLTLPGDYPQFDGGLTGHFLENVDGLFIIERSDFLEALANIERENQYEIKPLGVHKHAPNLFMALEKSDWFSRNCLKGNQRPFEIRIVNQSTGQVSLLLEREYSVPVCCLFRPQLKVFALGPQGEKFFLGRVEDTFDCANQNFNVYDHEDRLQFSVSSSCCQLALCCNLLCNSCREVEFDIKDANGVDISKAKREGQGAIVNMLTDADQFKIRFTK